MNLNDLPWGSIAALFTAAGAFIGVWMKYLLDKRQHNTADLKYLVERYDNDLRVLRVAYAELETKYNNLINRFELLEASKLDVSLPRWLKDREGRLIYGNAAFIDHFLTPSGLTYAESLDKTDLELFGDNEISRIYIRNGAEVMRNAHSMFFNGDVITSHGPVPYRTYLEPLYLLGKVSGVSGIAMPLR